MGQDLMDRMPTSRPGSRRAHLLTATLLSTLLVGCDTVSGWFGSSAAPPLPGERVAVLLRERRVEVDPKLAGTPVAVPPAQTNAAWPQAGGGPEHAMGNLALSANPAEAFRTDIGSGSSSSQMLLSVPVVADGRIFAVDADAMAGAFDAQTGRSLWQQSLKPEKERGDAMGGGVAYDGGRVYVTTGYGEVLALDAGNGSIVWRKRVSGPLRGAPTVAGGRVFAVTIDNQLVALNAADGENLWNHTGILETAGLLGASSPAANATVVVTPYSSGELVAMRPENGRVTWMESLAAIRRSGALSSLADIRGLPVLDRGAVYAIGHSGRMIAVDERIGARLWEIELGGTQTPYVAGEYVFVVTNDAEVVAITRRDGRIRWIGQLQQFEDPKDRTGVVSWAGPVMAGGVLWLTNSLGELVTVSPENGEVIGRRKLPSATFLPPVVANGTLYVLSDNGTLTAFR